MNSTSFDHCKYIGNPYTNIRGYEDYTIIVCSKHIADKKAFKLILEPFFFGMHSYLVKASINYSDSAGCKTHILDKPSNADGSDYHISSGNKSFNDELLYFKAILNLNINSVMFKHKINKDKYFDIKLFIKPCFKVLAKSTYKGTIDNKYEIKFYLHKNIELFPITKDIYFKNRVFPSLIEYFIDKLKGTRKYKHIK